MRRVPQLIVATGCLGWLLLYVGAAQTSADEEIERLKSEIRTMSATISKPSPRCKDPSRNTNNRRASSQRRRDLLRNFTFPGVVTNSAPVKETRCC